MYGIKASVDTLGNYYSFILQKYYSQTCSNDQLFKMTTHLRRPMLSLPKSIPVQSLLYKTTTCLTWSARSCPVRYLNVQFTSCVQWINFHFELFLGRVLNEVDKVENQKSGFTDEGDTAINNCIAHNLTNKDSDTKYEKLTLHRFQVTCKCRRNSRCARVLPQREQGWSGYLGSLNNGYFNKRPAVRLNV